MQIKIRDKEGNFAFQFEGEVRFEQKELQGERAVLLGKTCVIETEDGFVLSLGAGRVQKTCEAVAKDREAWFEKLLEIFLPKVLDKLIREKKIAWLNIKVGE